MDQTFQILLVENDGFSGQLEVFLKSLDIDCAVLTAAPDGKEIEEFSRTVFDAIVIDQDRLPETMDDLVVQVRAAFPTPPLLLLHRGEIAPETASAWRALGATEIVTSVDPGLVTCFKRYLRRDGIARIQQQGSVLSLDDLPRDLILNSIAEGLYGVDREGYCFFINNAAARMLGYPASELLGEYIHGIIHHTTVEGNPYPALQCPVYETTREGASHFVANELYWRKDGSSFPVEYSSMPIRDSGILGAMVSFRDVTQRQQSEEEIRRMNESLEQRVADRTVQLEATNKELEAFSYSVSHDLRAPLRAIGAFSTALLEDFGATLDDRAKHYINIITASADNMQKLIEDLLAFSRLTRKEMSQATVDMTLLARVSVEEARRFETGRSVRVMLPDLPPVQGDPALLKQVWTNLISNAFKFTRNAAEAVIEIGALEDGERITYFVKDNGAGFDQKYAGKLFGVFQRLHDKEEFEGTGVGLAIVQRIIHRHGGKVWAEAEPDRGATFYFTLDKREEQQQQQNDTA